MIDYRRQGCIQGHVTSLEFGKSVIISRKRCKRDIHLFIYIRLMSRDRTHRCNRRLIANRTVACRMAALSVTFSDLEGHF